MPRVDDGRIGDKKKRERKKKKRQKKGARQNRQRHGKVSFKRGIDTDHVRILFARSLRYRQCHRLVFQARVPRTRSANSTSRLVPRSRIFQRAQANTIRSVVDAHGLSSYDYRGILDTLDARARECEWTGLPVERSTGQANDTRVGSRKFNDFHFRRGGLAFLAGGNRSRPAANLSKETEGTKRREEKKKRKTRSTKDWGIHIDFLSKWWIARVAPPSRRNFFLTSWKTWKRASIALDKEIQLPNCPFCQQFLSDSFAFFRRYRAAVYRCGRYDLSIGVNSAVIAYNWYLALSFSFLFFYSSFFFFILFSIQRYDARCSVLCVFLPVRALVRKGFHTRCSY